MPLASLHCRNAPFDDGRLNQKVAIVTLKNSVSPSRRLQLAGEYIASGWLKINSKLFSG